jgi:hypothetical protein
MGRAVFEVISVSSKSKNSIPLETGRGGLIFPAAFQLSLDLKHQQKPLSK